MNQVEKISIGGYAFNFEENAAKELASYEEELRRGYENSPDAAEILEAMEDRICEILLENHPSDTVVSLSDIESVKAVLGSPNAIVTSSDIGNTAFQNVGQTESKRPNWWRNDSRKRLFRPRSGRVIGGVCLSFANYFDIDVTIVRVVWAALFLFGGLLEITGIHVFALLGYILFWICTPHSTESQEMIYTRNHDSRGSSRVISIAGRILKVSFGLLFVLIGICGLAAGVTALLGISWTGVDAEIGTAFSFFAEDFPGLTNNLSFKSMVVLLAAIYFIPFLVFLYEGLKLCFGFRSPSWHPGLVMIILWFVVIIALCILAAVSALPEYF